MPVADLSSPPGKPRSPVANWTPPATLHAREVLRATGTLFQLSWPSCLPLALLGVAASGAPGAESIARGELRGLAHSGEWWGLYVASMCLTLVCYGAVMLRQLALASGSRIAALDALRQSLLALPGATLTAILYLLAAPFILPAVWLSLAWTLVLAEGRAPLAACRRSFELVRGRFLLLAGAYLATLAAVLVFVMLLGIFFGVVMSLAGPRGAQLGVTVSRVLFAALLSLPVVYVSAMLVSCYRALLSVTAQQDQSPT